MGKAGEGRIDLTLGREGGDIVFELSDDGAGIDVAQVRVKATEHGLLEQQTQLSDAAVTQLVLAPGLSTSAAVTQISGRGVGLDVVHSEVKRLGGSISITSEPGEGTCFTLRVPYTVSVNRALMVAVGSENYAIPLNTIEGIVLLTAEQLRDHYNNNNETVSYAGASINCVTWASTWGVNITRRRRLTACLCCWCVPVIWRLPFTWTTYRTAEKLL